MNIRNCIVLAGLLLFCLAPGGLWAQNQKENPPPPVQEFEWLPGGEQELARVVPGQEPPGQEPYQITLQIRFECLLFDGDCGKFKIMKPPKSQAHFWITIEGCSREDTLAGEEIPGGVITLRPGELTLVKIAYFNDSDKPVKFRGIPHYVEPQNLQPMTIMNCLCLGQTYTVPPHTGWFRVIRLGPAYDAPNGSRLVVTHVLTSESLVD